MSTAPKKDPRNRPNEPFGGFGTTFGRRGGRPLKKHQRALLDELYPQIALEPKWDDGAPLRGAIDPAGYFTGSQSEEIWMEIGYGGGEHLAALAAANRDKGIIGGEFFASGVGKMLVAIEEAGLDNVRLHKGDARALLASLSDASLDRVYILYPDPWPKKRHARRRIISPWSIAELARILKPGAEVRVATDIPDYCRWILRYFGVCPDFEWMAEGPKDWREPWDHWTRTRYEAKALREGRTPAYLRFKRL